MSLSDRLARQLPARDRLRESRVEPWASVTFSGARHYLRYEADHVDIAALQASLEAIEFDLPGRIVADLTVASVEKGYVVELLTIDAA